MGQSIYIFTYSLIEILLLIGSFGVTQLSYEDPFMGLANYRQITLSGPLVRQFQHDTRNCIRCIDARSFLPKHRCFCVTVKRKERNIPKILNFNKKRNISIKVIQLNASKKYFVKTSNNTIRSAIGSPRAHVPKSQFSRQTPTKRTDKPVKYPLLLSPLYHVQRAPCIILSIFKNTTPNLSVFLTG